jgi:glycosyltransferase involved in cell wall biosynthesis
VTAAPLVSIGMPVRNEDRWVAEAIASLLAQTWTDFELTIADNASGDGTEGICRAAAARDARVRYVRRPRDVGVRENWNALAREARGRYFCWAPGHDRWRPDFLAACVAALEEQPRRAALGRTAASADPPVVLAYPLAAGIDADGHPIPVHDCRLDVRGLRAERRFLTVLFGLSSGLPIHGVMRTSAIQRTRGLGANVGPEYPVLAELALVGAIAHVPRVLFEYRRVREETAYEFTRRTLTAWQRRRPRQLVLTPEWELMREHLRVVRRAPLTTGSRSLLAACVAIQALDRLAVRGLRLTWLADDANARRSRGGA